LAVPLPAAWALDGEVERGEVASTADAPAVEPVVAAQSKVTLRGRVIVTQRDGTERADLDGEFSLYARVGLSDRWEPIRFQRGEWTALTTLDQASDGIRVDRMYADGIGAFVDEPHNWVSAPASGELTIRARVPDALILRVVDTTTAAHLSGVSLVRTAFSPHSDAQHPGLALDERVIATGLTSPIDVSSFSVDARLQGQSRTLVGAPGYAWSLLEVDLDRGGERTVALQRGAALTVSVRGVDPRVSEKLRLWTGDDQCPLLELPLTADGAIELDGLGAGELRVAAELGDWFKLPLVLAETSTGLRPGERASVTLDLAPAPKFETATASGLIFVAKAWAPESLDVELNLLDTKLSDSVSDRVSARVQRVTSDREGYDVFRWTSEDLQVGRYQLEVSEPCFSAVLEVSSGGRGNFEFVLDEPVELLVRVVDRDTGAALPSVDFSWAMLAADGSRTDSGRLSALQDPPFDEARRGFVVRTAPAMMILMVWGPEYGSTSDQLDVTRGVREYTFALERAGSIELTARSGNTRLAIPDGWIIAPRETSGGDANWSRSLSDDSSLIRIGSKPGVYELKPPRIPGYRELPLQRIEVFAGRKTEHVLEYEPERP
jgi:hypothetical protein